jgi:hypothetical protein
MMGLFKWIFKKSKNERTTHSKSINHDEIKRLNLLNAGDRMRRIIEWSDKGDDSKLGISNMSFFMIQICGLNQQHLKEFTCSLIRIMFAIFWKNKG